MFVPLKLLIVEDEARIAANLQKAFVEHHYAVDVAGDGEAALACVNREPYALIILDVLLPKLDGWQVLDAIRSRGIRVPVVMLTALNDIPDRVKGLQAGADDYLAKPFAFVELLARVEAILRRTRANPAKDQIDIADLTLQLTSQSVRRGTQTIALTPKEFQLLCALAENEGRFVSRQELAERVWGITFDCETNVVDVAIRRLRQKIDEGFDTRLIHTVRGVGYVLEQRQTAR